MFDSWIPIIVGILAALIIAIVFRFVIKHDISSIYDTNRSDLINGMLQDVYRVQHIMADVFEIVERQPDFTPREDMIVFFEDRDRRLLQWHFRQIHTFFDGIRGFNQWRTYLTRQEFFAIANYIAMSDGFLETLLNDLTYLPNFLTDRQNRALEIIDLLGNFVTPEFRNAWLETN